VSCLPEGGCVVSGRPPDDLSYRHEWRLRGLILVPIGMTAEDRFGDQRREMCKRERDKQEEAS
jgi:hypothetical protein